MTLTPHFYKKKKIIFRSHGVNISLKKRYQLRLAQPFETKAEALNRTEQDKNKRSLVSLSQ